MTAAQRAGLVALVAAVALLLVAEGAALSAAWLPVEEAATLERARGEGSAAAAGSILYPLLLAPAARTLSASAAYEVAKVLSALLWAAAAVPAFLLARRLVRPGPALLVAGLSVLVPGAVYTTAAVPDALAFLLGVSSLPLLARASERGGGRDLLGALALATAAALTRPWFAVLPPALLVAFELPSSSPRSFLRWPRSLVFAGAAGLAYVLLSDVAPAAGSALASPGAAVRAAAASLAVAVVGLGVLPWLVTASGAKPVLARPEWALLITCTPALVVAAGVFGTDRGLDERPLLVLFPLVLTLAAEGLSSGVVRVGAAGAAAAIVVAAALALPALGRAPAARAAGLSVVAPDGGTRSFLVTAAAASALVAVLLLVVLRRRPVLLAAALALVLLVGHASAWFTVRAEARELASAERIPHGWIDRHADPGARVLVVGPAESLDDAFLAPLTIWNRTVAGARAVDFTQADPATGELSASREDSNLVLVHGTDAALVGREIARSSAGVLLETPLPLRLAETTEGIFPDGWGGEQAVYRRFSGASQPGTVLVSMSRAAWEGAEPAEARIEVGPLEGDVVERDRVQLRPRAESELEIDVPPPPFRVIVTISPTIAAPDGRQLGAQLRFTYRPRQ